MCLEAVHPNCLDPKLGFVEKEHVVGAEFPDVVGELGHVANELTFSAKREPSTVFSRPVVSADPDATVAANHDTRHNRKNISHEAVPSNTSEVTLEQF